MKRIIEDERRPEPLTVYTDKESLEAAVTDAEEALAQDGYTDSPRYQVGVTLPPIDSSDEIKQHLESSPCFYFLMDASNGDHRRNERVYPSFSYENLDTVTEMMEDVDEAVDDAGYDINFWQIGGVQTPYDQETVPEHADEMEIQALARLDTDELITIGWFYRAPMDKTMEFGYRAFPDREFQPGDYDDAEEGGMAALKQIMGEREAERNEHDLSHDEVEMLYDIEEALLAHDIL